MRLIHTADWHLGRILHGVHLTEDQAFILDQFAALVKDAQPDAILIAGDVYDRAVPPPDAVQLLDETLSRLLLETKVPVVMIAGNHDSPQRLGFGSRLLAEQGLHVAGTLSTTPEVIELDTAAGPLHIFPLPFAEPPFVREHLDDDSITNHDSALKALAARARKLRKPDIPAALMAHCFVAGGEESESERPLSVGGAESVHPDAFSGFDYVALGHLHRPQTAGSEGIRYSGSLMKYSFSEVDHEKGVLLVELEAGKTPAVEKISLAPRRDVRCINGSMADLLAGEKSDDYLKVILEDEGPVLDAMARLRMVYPNTLHIERPRFEAEGALRMPDRTTEVTDRDLFNFFFEQVEGKKLNADQAAAFAAVVDAMDRQRREGAV